MPTSVKVCERQMAVLEARRAKLRKQLSILNARHRVWAERLRGELRRQARKQVKVDEGKAVKKVKGKTVVRSRGRPERWPGLCPACMRRHLGEPGGGKHLQRLCDLTQKHIAKLKK